MDQMNHFPPGGPDYAGPSGYVMAGSSYAGPQKDGKDYDGTMFAYEQQPSNSVLLNGGVEYRPDLYTAPRMDSLDKYHAQSVKPRMPVYHDLTYFTP